MTKLRHDFQITYPLKQKVVRDLRIVTEHVGDLIVSGTAYCDPTVLKAEVYDRYSCDIDFIRFNGTDIRPVLEITGGLEEIYEYCMLHASGLFSNEREVA